MIVHLEMVSLNVQSLPSCNNDCHCQIIPDEVWDYIASEYCIDRHFKSTDEECAECRKESADENHLLLTTKQVFSNPI